MRAMPTRRKIFAALILLVVFVPWVYAGWRTFHPPSPLLIGAAAVGALVLLVASWSPIWLCALLCIGAFAGAALLPVDVADSGHYGACVVVFIYPLFLFGRGFYRGYRKARAPQRKIIGLSGYAGAGKDTAAAGLIADGWTRVAVSDKIAELALRIDPPIEGVRVTAGDTLVPMFHPEQTVWLEPTRLSVLVDALGWTEVKKIEAVRELLQDLGTGVRDIIDPDAWVNATMRDLPDGDLVFTSVRFPNEAEALTKLGGKIIRVDRPGVGPVNDDVTETALDGWEFDGRLVNDAEEQDAADMLRRLAGAF